VTHRAEILQAIQAQLATLTIANGYSTDVGLNVRYWQDLPIEYDGPSVITFFDSKDDPAAEVGSLHEHRLEIRIDAIAYIKADAIVESCNLLADIVALIGKNRRWTKAVINTYLGENLKEIELKSKLAVRVTQELEIQYRAPFFKI
jgi:hypothetical protein